MTYNKSIFSIILIFVFLGCNKDFLKVSPPSSLTGEGFFRNGKDASSIVTAAYRPLLNTTNYAKATEATLDDIIIFNVQGLNLDSWSIDANDPTIDDLWQNDYEGVFRANIVIQEVPKINIDQSLKDRMMGEGRFLRALYYFRLTNFFGEVPIITEADPQDLTKSVIAKSSIDDVYKLIIEDLTQAITLLPVSYASADIGRATKGAAQALLGKVYLFNKNYPEAEANLKAVIDGPYSLLPNFSDVLIKDNNAESIFEIQFADLPGQGTTRIGYDYPQGQGGFSNLLPTQSLVDEFEFYSGPTAINGKDPRLFYSIFQQGDPYDLVSPVYQESWTPTGYARKKGSFPVIRTNNANLGINFPIIRLADVLLMYAEATNENNKPEEAISAINLVRGRVGMPALPTPKFPTSTKAQIFTAIVHERRVELAFEYHRLDDLRRWGLAEKYLGPLGYVSPKNLYFPIPQQELQTNPKLTQNPGY